MKTNCLPLLQKIRTSFTTQLTLSVAGFVLVTALVVIFLLGRYSQDVIHDETLDAVHQLLENEALRTDNRLRQVEMTVRLEGEPLTVDRAMIERFIAESGCASMLRQSLPNITLQVVEGAQPTSGADEYTFYHSIGNRSFGLLATCPQSDISGRFRRMQSLLLVWGVVGIVALLLILYVVVGHHLRSLHLLADAAQSIADGNLETPIPDAHHEHEAGRLQASLKKMQRGLKDYMDEMQQKQATLSAQNAELQVAYGEAQAYETMKAKFLADMTAAMEAPVADVCQCTEAICRDYGTMTKAEMARCQTAIMHDTEAITQLLDKLMNKS